MQGKSLFEELRRFSADRQIADNETSAEHLVMLARLNTATLNRKYIYAEGAIF